MRNKQQAVAQNPIPEEEAVTLRNKKKKRLSSPSPSAAAILEQEAKLPKKRKRSKEHGPSAQSPLPFLPAQTHSAHASNGKSTKTPSNTKKPRALSNREISKMRLEYLREQQASFVAAAMSEAHGPYSISNCTEQNPNHSSPFGAFFDQFCYKPVRQDRKPSLPRTPDRVSRLLPQGYPAFESSQLTANDTSEASKANTSLVSKTKLQGSASGSQAKVNVKENKSPEKKMEEKQMLSSSAPETPTLEQEAKATKKRMQTKEQEQSGPGQAHCVLLGTTAPPEQEADVKKNNAKKPRVLSNRKIVKMRIEHLRKQQACSVAIAMSEAHGPNSVSNGMEQNPNHSSPFGAFFDQFCYKPIRQDRNPLLPRIPDRLTRLPPRGYSSFESSQLTANETSKANTSLVSKAKQQGSGSGSQAKVNVREKKNSEMMKTRTKKQRKRKPLLTSAEKHSDKYRRLPLDQLVPPLRSPHKLLQEEYASDPWKVIVICMLLNLTQGKQVRKIVSGFFRLYPDAQTAFNADPEEMEQYLAPLGLQRVKTIRIQQFSREYVEKEWTYITELCGVGKYAADAYAIFCAGRATEVVPEDHKLVDYWKYVCSKLPMIQVVFSTQKENVPSADCTEKPQQKKRKAPAAEVTVSPQQRKRNAPAGEAAVSPQMKKRKTLSAESSQLKSKVAEDGQAESNMEKLFKKKCASYSFLSKEVLELEAKQPGMFKVPFLKLADEKAHTLDTKIKKQRVEEIKVHMQWGDIKNEVTNTLIKLLK